MSKLPRHILVIRMSAMGDVAMTVPVLQILSATYPELQITVLTRKAFAPFFEGVPQVKVHIAHLKGIHKGPLGLHRLAKELQALHIDAVADLHDVLRSQIIRKLLKWKGVPFEKIDKGRDEKKALVSRQNKVFKQLKTSHQRYADVFAKLGFPIDLSIQVDTEVPDISSETGELLELLCPQLDHYKNWIGIAPFAKHQGKAYPIDLMEEVIQSLVERNYLVLLFGGGHHEYQVMQGLDNLYPNVINMSGKISLQEEMRLMHQLDLLISMDSANMHIASLVGTRVLSLWGATHPYAGFYGWKQDASDALFPDPERYPDLPSSVYGNKVYDGYEDAMRSISPERIVQEAESMLLVAN